MLVRKILLVRAIGELFFLDKPPLLAVLYLVEIEGGTATITIRVNPIGWVVYYIGESVKRLG